MLRVLRVGDPHVTPDSLDDCQALLDLVLDTAKQYKVKRVEFLGDQYHTHAVMHVAVMAFWKRNFERLLKEGFEVLCLVGNHDMPGDGSSVSAMLAHPDIIVIDKPTVLDKILYIPYMSKEQDFIAACDAAYRDGVEVVIAHQSFDGATYENGFYCEDGFEPSAISQKLIISGHIHRPQTLVGTALDGSPQKVWYIGAPRWRIATDANTERHIHIMDHGYDGALMDLHKVPTSRACRQIVHLQDTPENPLPEIKLDEKISFLIDIYGPAAFVEERKKLWTFARVRTFNTDNNSAKVKESEGVEVAWGKYLNDFKPPHGTEIAVLKKMAEERLW